MKTDVAIFRGFLFFYFSFRTIYFMRNNRSTDFATHKARETLLSSLNAMDLGDKLD